MTTSWRELAEQVLTLLIMLAWLGLLLFLAVKTPMP